VALLRVEIGAEFAQLDTSNAIALAAVQEYLNAKGVNPEATPAEQLNTFLKYLIDHMFDVSGRHQGRLAQLNALDSATKWE